MHLRWMLLVLAIGASHLFSTTAHAITLNEYRVHREKQPPVTLDKSTPIASQLAAHAGSVIELEGTVTGIIASDKGVGFLLRGKSGQVLFFNSALPDPDIVVGMCLRVLAIIPKSGMYETIAVTPGTPAEVAVEAAPALSQPAGGIVAPVITSALPAYAPVLRPDAAPARVVDDGRWSTTPHIIYDGRYRGMPAEVTGMAERITVINPRISEDTAQTIAYHIITKSRQYDVDPWLTFALIQQESRFNPRAVSRSGARGLGQLMPATAAALGVTDSFDIEQNVDGAVRYLAAQLRAFGNTSLALAAYNAGPNSVRRHGGIPPYNETQHYVRVVWTNYCATTGHDPASVRYEYQ